MVRALSLIALLLWLPSAAAAEKVSTPDHLRLYSAKGDFDSVKEDVQLAITNRGLVIDNTSFIGNMLERTGKDLGTTKKIYGQALAMQFCSADVSRRTMEANPTNIVFCPYTVVVYTLPGDPKKVYVGYRRPQLVGSSASKVSLKAVDELLDGIVREAVNLK
jgi:uncharacterized protein (DUF302 family)